MIRVLHLDDSPHDAELIRERLGDGGGKWHFHHVATGGAFEEALANGDFDLILTDFSIPGYDGLAAVRFAHRVQPDVPIIVVSGTASEEDAVGALHAGATDYAFKQRLQRLLPAVRRALAEASERRRRRQAEARVRELSERFGEMAEKSQDVFWIYALQREAFVFVSPSVVRTWGLPPEVFYRDHRRWLQSVHPDDRDAMAAAFDAWVAGRAPRFDEQFRVVQPDGALRWIHSSGAILPDASGRVTHASGVARDITERRQAEEALRELNATLERRVEERTRELEAFSYSMSHDLRAPLHAVGGFAEALEQEYAALLDEQGRHYLRRIRAGAQRMEALIEDLLSLARITRADIVPTDVDLTAMVDDLAAELREAEPNRVARFHMQPGMRAFGDPGLLRAAVSNLLGNAWKFSAGRPEIRIEVGSWADDETCSVFYVRDNGAGFDPAHGERLFRAFQRLHGQSEFPGTGIGLAIVRRVIERHGGKVWAKGAVDRGATFFFSLPRRASAPSLHPVRNAAMR